MDIVQKPMETEYKLSSSSLHFFLHLPTTFYFLGPNILLTELPEPARSIFTPVQSGGWSTRINLPKGIVSSGTEALEACPPLVHISY
jgi:hypothetical protein